MVKEIEVSALDALLGATTDVKEDVYIPRLKANFTVKGIDGDELAKMQEQCTVTYRKGVKLVKETDEERLGMLLIASACVSPDFNDKTLQAHYKASDAVDCVKKSLLAGEIAKLTQGVLGASGFENEDEMIEEAKN